MKLGVKQKIVFFSLALVIAVVITFIAINIVMKASIGDDTTQGIGVLAIAGIVILVISGLVAVAFGNSITKPIVLMTGVARKLAEGDVELRIEYESADEIGILADSLRG